MAEVKKSTIKDLEQAMTDLGLSMIEDYYKGNVNEHKLKLAEKIIDLYEVVKNKDIAIKKCTQ